MKIHSFAVSLIVLAVFSVNLISCAIPSASPTLTPLAKQTPTLVISSQTLAPTPSPESLLPQEVKEKFELAGVYLANMQNAKYDKDGLHITLSSGEVIVLTNDQLQKGIYNGQDNVLQYRDETNQNAVYAFDKETGKWGVGISEAESVAIALFDKYGVDPDTYTLAEVDGIIVGTDNETGKEILRDGRFEIGYAVELAKKDCEQTDFEPDEWGSNAMPAKYGDTSSRYLETLLNDTNYLSSDGALTVYNILIDRTKQCWGFVDGDALLYRDQTGLAQIVSTIHIPKNELFDFLFNQ